MEESAESDKPGVVESTSDSCVLNRFSSPCLLCRALGISSLMSPAGLWTMEEKRGEQGGQRHHATNPEWVNRRVVGRVLAK